MPHKLAIFDLDGTLLDTLKDLAASCNHALAAFAFPTHAAEDYKNMIGRGMTSLIQSALPPQNRDDATVTAVKECFLAHYGEHSQDKTRPYDGALDMLAQIRSAGIKTAVLSNKAHINAKFLCAYFFPDLIDLAMGLRDGVPAKPDPQSALEILRLFGALPNETVYIGDSGVDMKTGKNAGLYTIGVTWGFRPKDELTSSGADVIVDKISDLAKIIVDK